MKYLRSRGSIFALIGGIFLALSALCDAQQAKKEDSPINVHVQRTGLQRFELTAGKDVEVCNAYVGRLNRTQFVDYPFCDRPEADGIPAFGNLSRIPLNEREIRSLFETVSSFTWVNDAQASQKLRDQRHKLGAPNVDSVTPAVKAQVAVLKAGRRPLFFKLKPQIDLDNDGRQDDVVLWRNPDDHCGNGYGDLQVPMRSRTHILLLDRQGTFDVRRTQSLFDYAGKSAPGTKGNWTYIYRDQAAITGSGLSGNMRPSAAMYGVFIYKGKTYVDSFYDIDYTISEKPTELRKAANTLFVTSIGSKPLRAICEIQWDAIASSETTPSNEGLAGYRKFRPATGVHP